MTIQLTRASGGRYTYRGTVATYVIWSEQSLYGDRQWFMDVEYAVARTVRNEVKQADYLKTMRWIIEEIEGAA